MKIRLFRNSLHSHSFRNDVASDNSEVLGAADLHDPPQELGPQSKSLNPTRATPMPTNISTMIASSRAFATYFYGIAGSKDTALRAGSHLQSAFAMLAGLDTALLNGLTRRSR